MCKYYTLEIDNFRKLLHLLCGMASFRCSTLSAIIIVIAQSQAIERQQIDKTSTDDKTYHFGVLRNVSDISHLLNSSTFCAVSRQANDCCSHLKGHCIHTDIPVCVCYEL